MTVKCEMTERTVPTCIMLRNDTGVVPYVIEKALPDLEVLVVILVITGPSTGLQTIFQGLHAFIAFLEKLRYLIVQAALPISSVGTLLITMGVITSGPLIMLLYGPYRFFRSSYRWVCLFYR